MSHQVKRGKAISTILIQIVTNMSLFLKHTQDWGLLAFFYRNLRVKVFGCLGFGMCYRAWFWANYSDLFPPSSHPKWWFRKGITSLRILTSFAVENHWEGSTVDVKTAFLNAEMDMENLDGAATAFLGGKAGGSSHAVHANKSTLFAPRHRTINWHGVFQPACLGAALSTLAAKELLIPSTTSTTSGASNVTV